MFIHSPRVVKVIAARNLLSLDAPAHTQMRNTVNRAFTPRRIAAWEPRIRALTEQLATELRRKRSFDFVTDFAVPLPVTVIVELLGVEPERSEEFKRWSEALTSGVFGPKRKLGLVRSGALEALGKLSEAMRRTIRARLLEPQDDLISVLVRAQAGEGVLSEPEAVFFAVGLLVAGNETTTRLLGSMVKALLDHPEQLHQVRSNRALIPAVVEEVMRWEGPAQLTGRRARRDVEIAGMRIPRNAHVALLLASGNRDEREWGPTAEAFDVTRDARRHLASAWGRTSVWVRVSRGSRRGSPWRPCSTISLDSSGPLRRSICRRSWPAARVDSRWRRAGERSAAPRQIGSSGRTQWGSETLGSEVRRREVSTPQKASNRSGPRG